MAVMAEEWGKIPSLVFKKRSRKRLLMLKCILAVKMSMDLDTPPTQARGLSYEQSKASVSDAENSS